MIGKVKIGKNFIGICRYVFREDKNARVLDAVGVRTENATEMSQDFEFQRSLRPGLGNAVMHVALALPVEDSRGRSPEEVSELLRQIGRAYVREMKLENTQWALIEHTDKAHPHAHLLVNRVDDTGQTISDKFIGQQSRRVCQGIEQKMQLTVAEQQGRDQVREAGPTHRQAVATTPRQQRTADWQRARHNVANALQDMAPSSVSFEQLQTKLKTRGVELVLKMHEKEKGPAAYGVVFEQGGHRIKGSEVSRGFSAPNLEKGFAQVRELQETYRQQTEAHLSVVATTSVFNNFAEYAALVPTAGYQFTDKQASGERLVIHPSGMEFATRELRPGGMSPGDLVKVEIERRVEREEVIRIGEQIRAGRKKLAALEKQVEQAERVGDYGRVAALRYGEMQTQEAGNKSLEDKLTGLVGGREQLTALNTERDRVREEQEQARRAEEDRKRLEKDETARGQGEQLETDRERAPSDEPQTASTNTPTADEVSDSLPKQTGEGKQPTEDLQAQQVAERAYVQGYVRVGATATKGVEERFENMKGFLTRNGLETRDVQPPEEGKIPSYSVFFSYSPTAARLDDINKTLNYLQREYGHVDTVYEAPHVTRTVDQAERQKQNMRAWKEREGQHSVAHIVIDDSTNRGYKQAERIKTELESSGGVVVSQISHNGHGQVEMDVSYHTYTPSIDKINNALNGANGIDGVQVQESDQSKRARDQGETRVQEKKAEQDSSNDRGR